MGTIEMFGIDLGTMTFRDSSIQFLGCFSGHFLDPVLHRQLVDRYRQLIALSL
ncbi:hypothetical protein HAX54_040981, partial [Datura stramonium]|nr:hypothetical protein [Datura stramonium]